MKLEFFSTNFFKSTEISNFMKIGVVGVELFHADGQTRRGTDGRTWRSLQSLFAILWTHLKILSLWDTNRNFTQTSGCFSAPAGNIHGRTY